MNEKEKEFLSNLKKFNSFNIFFYGLNSINLDLIDKEIKKGFDLRLDIKNKQVPGMQLLRKGNEKWKVIYSNHLDNEKEYTLKEIVEFLKKQ